VSVYDRWILPRLTHFVMRSQMLADYRARAVAAASGDVLEIGMGSGLNLPFYGQKVRRVIGVEPSAPLVRIAEEGARRVSVPVDFLLISAEELPLPDSSVDTAVTTWSLCTIPDPVKALREVRRVLRSSGQLIFVEHGLAPESGVATWQNRLTPLCCRCAGGCHLNRPIADLVREAGFVITNLQTGYMSRPKFASFMYDGTARSA
jgi:ubiquinone/menaquinone biosynthesis C-methylase UbiE